MTGDSSIHVNTNGAATFESFQFRLHTDFWNWLGETANPFVNALQIAGCLRLHDENVDIHFPKAGPFKGIGDVYTLTKGKEWGDC